MIDIFSKFNPRIFADRDQGKWYSHPGRDWKIIFSTAAVGSLCLIAVHGFFYDYILKHDILFSDPLSQEEQDDGINEKGLRNVMIEFSVRKTRTDMLFRATSTMADPSISTTLVSVPGTGLTSIPVVEVEKKAAPNR